MKCLFRRLGGKVKRFVMQSTKALAPLALDSLPPRLHVGCGPVRAEGWINIDIAWSPATDVVVNIRGFLAFRTVSQNRFTLAMF